ncbi:hypothetical protein I6M56_18400 [Shewanella algae]|uniref:hypothetical protein n=1 Tax=Shewanella algae TaxID=38313 RepID=UPI001AAEE363|nr:hypothetical protein [Shewanella algae]MBO2680807.1 hypothetical protein [Shewanella algae]
MNCISSFLENMEHEFPNHTQLNVNRNGYKVDGEGIKKKCRLDALKSVDYYEIHEKYGFLYVEFSDLLKQEIQIQERVERVNLSDLSKRDKRDFLKRFFNEINRELVAKFKDSFIIRRMMPDNITNIPDEFDSQGTFVIVIAPLAPQLKKEELIEITKFLDTLKDKVIHSIPRDMFTKVKVTTLDKFCT